MRRVEDVDAYSREYNRTIPLRFYYPTTTTTTTTTAINGSVDLLPMIMWVHGGGWVLGNIESDDWIARKVAHVSSSIRRSRCRRKDRGGKEGRDHWSEVIAKQQRSRKRSSSSK